MMENNEVSKKRFAEMHGWSPSYVTALGNAGRLVLSKGGKVLVSESNKLIKATEGSREDVRDRHAAGRLGQSHTEDEGVSKVRRVRLMSEARRAVAVAEQEEMRTAQMRGDLIQRSDVDAAMLAIGAAIRAALDVMPDQTAPVVAPVTALDEVHAILTDAKNNVLERFGQEVKRQQDELAKAAKK